MDQILIIENDGLVAAMEEDFLRKADFTVTVAHDAKTGLKLLDQIPFTAVLLEVTLPDEDGFAVCYEIRKNYGLPILFVTARDSDEDKVKGLGMGADDYIVKPFNPTEMVARVKAHIRIHDLLLSGAYLPKDEAAPDIRCGDLRIFVRRRQVFRGKREILLTGKEFNLLLYLARHPNQVLSKRELFEQIWHLDALGEMATVTVHINRLRDKMNEVRPRFTAIETVWGNGYRFRMDEV